MLRQRKSGRLVAVKERGRVMVPTFQFDRAYNIDPGVSSIVTQLLARQMSDWAVWTTWFASPNTWLDGVAPRAALRAGDVAAVRKAAARLFEE